MAPTALSTKLTDSNTLTNSNKILSAKRPDKQLVETHPCYSKDAHKYARMHLPVAPACNIQCNYCNRKFDCSNESRPGVVSKLLSPSEAVHRFQTVKKRMPELKVVGIAGPGDPLANPKATLATLKAISEVDDDVHLCVSTNGLNLPEHVDALSAIGVHHLTITINSLDPNIGQYLYPWIYFNNQRYYGLEAAKLLIKQQLTGLSLAIEKGILVKVNTVLVPGINTVGLEDLAKEIKDRGAFLHNIMPLISDPSHGTFFGLNHVKGPSEEQVEQARAIAGVSMEQMSHCKQCRADAVGTLSDDHSGGCASARVNQFSQESDYKAATAPSAPSLPLVAEKPAVAIADNTEYQALMRVAVASSNNMLIDTHFGHAKAFHIYDLSADSVHFVETRTLDQYCHGKTDCDDYSYNDSNENIEHNSLASHIACLSDCQQVLCARIGIGPWQTLEAENIKPQVEFAMLGVLDSLNILRADLKPQLATNTLKEVS